MSQFVRIAREDIRHGDVIYLNEGERFIMCCNVNNLRYDGVVAISPLPPGDAVSLTDSNAWHCDEETATSAGTMSRSWFGVGDELAVSELSFYPAGCHWRKIPKMVTIDKMRWTGMERYDWTMMKASM